MHEPRAGATEVLLFHVDLADGRREVHHAAFVVAVLQAERVADLVDDLLANAVGEHLARGLLGEPAVGGGLEAVRGDDAARAVEVRQAEDVVAPSVEQVVRRDGDVLVPVTHSSGQFDELLGTVLPAVGVVRPVRNRLSGVDGDIAFVDRPEPGRRLALDDGGDVTDRHDVNVHEPRYGGTGYKPPDASFPRVSVLTTAAAGARWGPSDD